MSATRTDVNLPALTVRLGSDRTPHIRLLGHLGHLEIQFEFGGVDQIVLRECGGAYRWLFVGGSWTPATDFFSTAQEAWDFALAYWPNPTLIL